MGHQTDINEKMRAILIDWLIEVHLKFKLMPETMFLTVNLIDRFLERKLVIRQKLQLVGVTAMLLASKYEEIYAPEVRDFVYITDKAYAREQILGMEAAMLTALEFRITVPTVYVFLNRYLKVAGADERTTQFATYLVERTLRRREADALQRPFDEALEALQRQRHVRAALRRHQRVDLVDDHRLDAAQRLARPGRQQQIERLRRRDQDLRAAPPKARALLRGCVAGPHRDVGHTMRNAARGGEAREADERRAQVALDVDGERLQRRDIEDATAPLLLRKRREHHALDRREERRQRLAGARRREQERRF